MKHWKFVERLALPFLNSTTAAPMFRTFEVNGALIEASLSERANPASAYLRAPQSLAPSPTIPTVRLEL